METIIINTYEVLWEDGIWDNNNKLAIHIPHLKKNFKIEKKLRGKFFVGYDKNEILEELLILYIDLNDIVFNATPWRYLKRAKIYTLLEII